MFSFTLESENWNLLKLDLQALRFLFFLVLEQWHTFSLPGNSDHWGKNCSNCSNSIFSFQFSGLCRIGSEMLMAVREESPQDTLETM